MSLQKIYSILLVLSALCFTTAAILTAFPDSNLTKLIFVLGFLLLSIGIMGVSKLKKFAYTFWILSAVILAMFYPEHLKTVGSFDLKLLIVPIIQITMFGMGCQMSFEDFKGVLKMPKGVLIGICCHFLVMPFVGYALAHLLNFPMEIASGVILIGCVSSALASNVMSYISGANLALAITIGAFSTIISPFLTPLLMKTLAGQYIQVDVLDMMVDITNMVIIPIVAGFIFNLFYYAIESRRKVILQLLIFAIIIAGNNLILMVSSGEGLTGFIYSFSKSMLFFYLLPMLLAILFKYFLKDNRSLIEKSFAFVAMMGIVFNTAIITASGRNNLIEVGGLLIISCLIHNLTGLTLGYFVAWLFKMPERDCRTIAFEVGMQNGGIATGLALEMGKVATVGLASTIIGPLQNVTGSALANYFRSHPTKDKVRNTDNIFLDKNNSFSMNIEEQVVEVDSMEEMQK